jgi:hypothetical protein
VRSAEDPITAMRGSKGGMVLAGGFQLLVDEDCVRGGYTAGSKNQQLLDFNLDDLTEEELRRVAGDDAAGSSKHSKSHHRSHRHHHHSRHEAKGGSDRGERRKDEGRGGDCDRKRGKEGREQEGGGRESRGREEDGRRHGDGSRERRPRSRSGERTRR